MTNVAFMEPVLIRSDAPAMERINNLAWELNQGSSILASQLPPAINEAVVDLVRSMNCYYSNLIEGHATHPIDIDNALKEKFLEKSDQRNLQLEAIAHIKVQRWIDKGGLEDLGYGPIGIKEVHRRFYERLPDSFHWVVNPKTGERVKVIPGEYRDRGVQVGKHIPIPAEDISRFMSRWDESYSRLQPMQKTTSAAAAHHRLVWIHPFLDGNGRVARLITHEMLRQSIPGVGLWSVSRGFARSNDEYKRKLAACDLPRQGDRDGRGQLSEAALVEFTEYFLKTCLDQVNFMSNLLRLGAFKERLLGWLSQQSNALQKATSLIQHILIHGEVSRPLVPKLLNTSERTSRRSTAELLDRGLLSAEHHKAPLKLALPLSVAMEIFPGLIPENNR